MKKIIVLLLIISSGLFPTITKAAVSSGRVSTPSVRSAPSVKVNTSRSNVAPRGKIPANGVQGSSPKLQGSYNTFSYNYLPIWAAIWIASSNHNDDFSTHDHSPYIIVLNKTTKSYQLLRYIGADNKTEKVSPEEENGLSWLKDEIKY